MKDDNEKSKMAAHFSSATDLWATPQHVFDEWNERFNFQTDVCAIQDNAKCPVYFTPEEDGLKTGMARCLLDEPTLRSRHQCVGEESPRKRN